MAWSTREIAELAGTSLRAVRHYHEVGLLEEPERLSNGYKQYGVAHLVRLLRIKRLVDLGFSLPQIAAMGEEDGHPEEALRALDAELEATIQRLQRVRAELGLILRDAAPTDLPPEFASTAARAALNKRDRAFIAVMARVLGPTAVRAYNALLQDQPRDPLEGEFDDLPADADEATRQSIAVRLAPVVRGLHERHPELNDFTDAPHGAGFIRRSMGTALRELYNPAQLDVMVRLHALLFEDGPES
jgi:DNA-binding transcriptional MerR regulator